MGLKRHLYCHNIKAGGCDAMMLWILNMSGGKVDDGDTSAIVP